MKMKLSYAFMVVLFAAMSFSSHGQEWVQMMRDPNVNFYDVQTYFNQYWEGRTIEKGKGYKAFRRWEAYMAPRVYPSGDMTLPTKTYENFIQWEQEQSQAGVIKSVAGNWTILGPVGKPSGGGAGRLNFVRFDPNNSTIMYVGAPDGGLWKTTNGGSSWSTNTDQLTVIGVTDIAINPANTQTMYIATGDGEAGDSFSTGVLKSTDGGVTWNTTGLNWTASQGRTISRLLINPTNPQILMAFGSNGIWRTSDGGATWTQPTGTFNGVMDAEFKPGDPNTVYAAGTVFKRSTDGGLNWSTISTGLTGIGRLSIAVTPANSAYVYVLAARGSDSGFLGLIRSTNSGTSFTTRMASNATNNILGWDNGGDAGGQGWYDLALAVSPTNADEVFTGGINMWRSTNGGTSFTLNSHWTGSYSKPYVHADIHDIQFLPGSGTTLFSCNDGGINRSTNNGTGWSDISANLAIAQQYRIGQSTSNASLIIAGHQDNGTNRFNGTWTEVYGGDGMDCFIDRTNNNIMVGSYVYGDYYRSTNGGGTFTPINTGLPAGTEWLSVIHQDPVTATTYYAGGRNALYRTTNSGTSWSALGTPTGTGAILEFAIAPSNNQIIYALKSGTNGVSKSTNGGTNFTAVSTGLPTTVQPSGIAISNTDPNLAFVTYSGYGVSTKVFKTTNGGTSWTNISTGLPNIPVNCVVYSNGSTDAAIYVGTDMGVYYKNNTSAWIAFNTGLPNCAVTDLEIYYSTGRLRAATFGRGTWDSDLYTAVPAVPAASFTASSTTICVGQSVTFTNTSSGLPDTYAWSFQGGSPINSIATNPTVTYNTAGVYDVTLTATNSSGSNTNTQTAYITVLGGTGGSLPLTEGFTTATFPPTGWTIINLDLGDTTWRREATVGNAPTGGNSMWFDNFNFNDAGNTDEMRTPRLNFSGYTSAQVTFDVAYAAYSATYVDGLEVAVSTDCGASWANEYSKTGSTIGAGNLPTVNPMTALFVPTSASQWRTETVSLNSYIGQSNVIIAFRNLAGYGNALYVDNINITGVAAPTPPTASFTSAPSGTACIGQTVQYTSTSAGSPTSYNWTFQGGTPATSTAQNPTVTYASTGAYNVSLTVTNASGSNTSNQTAYINVINTPATPGAITGTASVCSGTTGLTYSIAAVAGATSYTWTVPSGSTISSGQGTTSITVAAGTTSGNVTVTATNGCGTSAAQAFALSVNAAPVTPGTISGTSAVCSGSTGNTYSISAVAGATSYTWTVPAGSTITAGQGTTSITVISGATAGNITVTATNGCGTSAAQTFTLSVNTVPAIPGTINGTAAICSGSTGNTYSIAAVSGATSYAWSVPTGSTITAGQGTTSITVTAGSTTGNITVTASNGCGTSSAATFVMSVNTAPAAPGTVSGSATVCAGAGGITYSVTSVSGATGYTWSVPAGTTITAGQGTTSITVTAGSTSGNISVTSNNGCGSSTATLKPIIINTAPSTPGTITGSAAVCSGTTGNTYSIAAVSGASSYTWSVPTGATITSGQGTTSVNLTSGTTSGTINVTATNSCGTSTAAAFALIVNAVPAAPGTISGSATACSTSPGNVYSIAAVTGATTYNWTVPTGSTITAGQGTTSATITFGSTSGNITVTTSNGCGASSETVILVTLSSAAPATPGAISGSSNVCQSATGNTYSIAAVTGATNYTWTVPVGSTITSGQGTTSIAVDAGSVGGTISVVASSTCGTSGSSTFTLTIDPLPTVTDPIDQNVCEGGVTNLVQFSGSGSTYTWTNDNTAVGLVGSGSGDIASFTATDLGVATISVIPDLNGCLGTPQTFTITVNALPVVSQSNYSTVCENWSPVSLMNGSPSGGFYSGTGVAGSTFDPVVSGVGTFTITYSLTENGCSNSADAIITVDACAGIGESEEIAIQIYPNPTKAIVNVTGDDLMKFDILELTDAAGRLIRKYDVKSTTLTIDFTSCATGVYSLRFRGNDVLLIKRITIE
jgi:PKD repeat protein